MSKRAEQRALEAYPDFSPDGKWQQSRKYERIIYKNGYEQAEKDFIHMVKTWLSEIHRVCDITDENGYRIELRNLIASFEKTLEEE